MKEFVSLRAKTYVYLINGYNDDDYHKKKIIIKNYNDSLLNDEIILKSQLRFKSDHHKVYTEEVNKISLSSDDGKKIKTFDKITNIHTEQILLKCVKVKYETILLKKYANCQFYD